MITALDDLGIHQGYGTLDQVESGDPRWFEALWFHVGLPSGELAVAGHLGCYPVANTMDAAASIRMGQSQWNVRAARELQRDRANMSVGPIRAEVLEPFRRWRFVLEGDTAEGPALDLELVSDHYPMEVGAPVFHRHDGRHVTWEMWHYVQSVRANGTVTIDGEQHTLSAESTWGVRDRSWGVRPIFGQVPLKAPLPDSIARSSTWLAARFADRDIWLWQMEPVRPFAVRAFGNLSDETGRVRLDGRVAGPLTDAAQELPRILSAELHLETEPDTPLIRAGQVTATDSDGRAWPIAVRPLSALFSRGLGYGNPEFRHVEHKSDSLQRDVYDLSKAATVAELTSNPAGHINPYGIEQFCEFECNGDRGYGVIRTSV